MRTMQISKFKARCLRILDEVATSGEALVITRHGRPIARVLPMPRAASDPWMGCLEGTAEVRSDLVPPVMEPQEWEALRE